VSDDPTPPKIFHMSDRRDWIAALGVALAFFGVLALIAVSAGGGRFAIGLSAFAVVIAVALWSVVSATTCLWPDRIETFNGFRRRRLRVEEVRAYRRHPKLFLIQLIPHDRRLRPVWVPSGILAEKHNISWIGALVDAEQEAKVQLRRDYETDPRLGATNLERQMFMSFARRWARVLTVIGWLIGAWLFFWPEPYELAIAAGIAVPACAIALFFWSHGFVRIAFGDKDPRPSVGAAFLPPGVALWVLSIDAVNHVDATVPGLLALGGGCALGAAFVVIDKGLRTQVVFAFVLAGWAAMYLYAALIFANAQLDPGTARVFRTEVLDKRVTTGKGPKASLQLSPWGSVERPRDVTVPTALYDQTTRGDVVCVSERPGFLSWRWYTVARCA
jgi:hypothetical protein